ncbi:MAG: ABC transporter ATP-binding protein, partial [Deltaproteobacteria bacterium]|nr:ABC transporter ATP-binding protein [Deltaproteobacteria bacterium]
ESNQGQVVSLIFSLAYIFPGVHPLISSLLVITIATLFKNLLGYVREVLSVFMGLTVREECQRTLFRQLLRASYGFFLDRQKGDLQYRVVTAPGQMGNLVNIVPNLFTELFKCLAVTILLFYVSFKITLMMCVVGALFFVIIRYLASNVSHYTGRGRAEASSDMTVYCNQALLGIKVLKVFKAEKFWENMFNSAQRRFYRLAKKDTVYVALPSRLLETIAITTLCLLASWIFIKDGAEVIVKYVPLIGLFAVAVQRLIPSFNTIGREFMQFMALLPYGEASYSAIRESKIESDKKGLADARFDREIRFKDVCLSYDNGVKNVLDRIDFRLKKGDFLAIVGESGAGKTSIIDLLLKMKKPTSGSILLDSVSLWEINSDQWFDLVGYVGQEIFMFNGTIRDNVLLGLEGISDESVVEALRLANAMEFVDNMENGIDAVIGEEGLKLSGGQRQRIAIARALIREPEILLFDEATSSLDNISERLIKEAITNLARNKTIIIVSHNLRSVIDAKNVIVLDQGRIVEQGSPDDLLSNGRKFSELYAN